jgi:hypothetical protein
LLLPIVVVVLAGCNTLTHSPIVFTSRQTIGVDIRPTPSDTARPGVSIGIRNSDFAWVPAVALGDCIKWKESATPDDKKHITRDWPDKCESGAMEPRPLLARSKDTNDVLSVYGQFDAKVGGFSDTSDQKLAKVFAVGLAAQKYTEASSARARNECLQAVDKLVKETIATSADDQIKARKREISVSLKKQCVATSREEKK